MCEVILELYYLRDFISGTSLYMYMQQKQDGSGMCEVVLELLHLWNESVHVHAAKTGQVRYV